MWKELGRTKLHELGLDYTGASNELMKVLENFRYSVKVDAAGETESEEFVVTKHHLNLLGMMSLRQLQVNVDPLIHATSNGMAKTNQHINAITTR